VRVIRVEGAPKREEINLDHGVCSIGPPSVPSVDIWADSVVNIWTGSETVEPRPRPTGTLLQQIQALRRRQQQQQRRPRESMSAVAAVMGNSTGTQTIAGPTGVFHFQFENTDPRTRVVSVVVTIEDLD
jgi:hypothetical protein